MKISSVNNITSKVLSARKRIAPKNNAMQQKFLPRALNQEDIIPANTKQKNLSACGSFSDSCGGAFDFCGAYM